MRKVKSPLKHTTPLQICSAPFLNSPERVLVQKWPIFQLCFLGNIGQENVFHDILEWKKRLSRLYKKEDQKVEKLTFFQEG